MLSLLQMQSLHVLKHKFYGKYSVCNWTWKVLGDKSQMSTDKFFRR